MENLLVSEMRGRLSQADHFGDAILLRAGKTIWRVGDPERFMHWRSAAKPIQAIPFEELGVRKSLGLSAEHLAIACSSHNSEPAQVQLAMEILEAANIPVSALRCGGHIPLSPTQLQVPIGGWQAVHSNCSGKHAAMLATCKHLGQPLGNYLDSGPLQQIIASGLQKLLPASSYEFAIDGCMAPTFVASTKSLALAISNLANTSYGEGILRAMATNPGAIGGAGRACTQIMSKGNGKIAAKVGAEGVYVAHNLERNETFAVKLWSGSRPAAEQLAIALTDAIGWVKWEQNPHQIYNTRNVPVGEYVFPSLPRA